MSQKTLYRSCETTSLQTINYAHRMRKICEKWTRKAVRVGIRSRKGGGPDIRHVHMQL